MLPSDSTAVQPRVGQIITVFFGMTASGKSALGMAWADQCQAAYYNTDRVRKELAGLQVSDRRPDDVGQGIYAAAFTEKTYRAMLDHVREDCSKGVRQVVLDGSYSRREDRNQVRSVAGELGARCVFIFCTCPEDEIRRRLELRSRDPQAVSDGRWEIYLHQRQSFEIPDAAYEEDCLRLNTNQPIMAMLKWLSAQPCFQG
jgi:uncharacterized protein